MGEQPLFSCKAHVFQLEPEMKKSWIALSTAAVNVQIFHDPIKSIYRIVSVEGTKALINSIVTPKMTFTKTSQKFGQWIDFKLNLVYGLGFANDVELNKFVDKFKEIKEMTRHGAVLRPHERSNSCEITNLNRIQPASDADSSPPNENNIHLKHENDRLKMTLSQTASQTRKIEEELQSLKTSNARLVSALQENHTNMDEWKKQLQYYKDECSRLRNSKQQPPPPHLSSSLQNSSSGMLDNNNDSDEVVSSSSSFNNHRMMANNHNDANNHNNKKLKQELLRLTESFDKKFKELHDIREQIRQLTLEIN